MPEIEKQSPQMKKRNWAKLISLCYTFSVNKIVFETAYLNYVELKQEYVILLMIIAFGVTMLGFYPKIKITAYRLSLPLSLLSYIVGIQGKLAIYINILTFILSVFQAHDLIQRYNYHLPR